MTAERHSRNMGLITPAEQGVLGTSRVAIAGLGGVGGRLATRLAALGVRSFAIADPDVFEESNINRQEGAGYHSVGQPKVEVIARLIGSICPEAVIDSYPEGVNDANVADFVAGSSVVVEAADYLQPGIGVRLARAARTAGVPLVLGVEVGFGAFSTWFPAHGSSTYEDYLRLPRDVDPTDLDSGEVQADFRRWVPHVPNYVDPDVLAAVAAERIPAPAIAPAVDLSSAMLSTLCFELAQGHTRQRPAPTITYVDVKERRAGSSRYPTAHHYASLARLAIRRSANSAKRRMGQ